MKYDHTPHRRRERERRTGYNRRPRRPSDHKERDRRDASSGWREEYRTQHARVPYADGGTTRDVDREGASEDGAARYVLPAPGTRVRDRESDAGDELLVLATEEVRADEYTIEATDKTVAEHNPDYPGWAPVVRCVYTEDLDAVTAWRSLEDLRDAVDEGALRAYTFPAPRLGPLPDDEGGDPE